MDREQYKMKHTGSTPKQQKHITKRLSNQALFSIEKITKNIKRLCSELKLSYINENKILNELQKNIFSEMTTEQIQDALIMSVCSFIEDDPEYSKLASFLLIEKCIKRIGKTKITTPLEYEKVYRNSFISHIKTAVADELLDKRMLDYDLQDLAAHINLDNDLLFEYTGIFTLYERYFMKSQASKEVRLETPQGFWMRIAMGLALNEKNKQAYAKQFYDTISSMRYIPSTPTLFHAGFVRSQLSSCYLNISADDLSEIFKTMSDNAQLSKWAGGIGTSWTPIRGTGAYIKGIKATSQGVVPYLKIADDVIGAITRAGIRRGGKCAYLEVWHYDIEDFLDLRKNTGDHRRRTHDMNTAAWIPDLFMERVQNNEMWTLFSPNETPDLHETYGEEFKKRYLHYEEYAKKGLMKLHKTIAAKELWKQMLMRLFETGHPWITFKDACNIRSPQDHCGIIHSSNLCTEITLNTSKDETAVCNLGSLNLINHIIETGVNYKLLEETITCAMRMLDNVVDLNFYPTEEAKNANTKHRPVGLGMMGWQDVLYHLNMPIESQEAENLCDQLMEKISYCAINASSELAIERGPYASFKGSKWSKGIFPYDTLALLEKTRSTKLEVNRNMSLDWSKLKEKVTQHGIRNSNTMAIAPTATIATIAGCTPSIEPIYKNLYTKSNISGEFTISNKFLVKKLKTQNLWNEETKNNIKFYDGSVQKINSIDKDTKAIYKTAFEVSQEQLLKLTAIRAKWIDQSQSHNVFFEGVSGKALNDIYIKAWKLGMKTTYYLRSLGASQIEKSTLDAKYGLTQMRSQNCNIDEGCESCQ